MNERCLNLNFISLRDIRRRRVYYHFNHDESLLCWYFEKKRLNIGTSFLITIDGHIDFVELSEEEKQIISELQESKNSSSTRNNNHRGLIDDTIYEVYNLREIIERQFRGDNVSFIPAAMELDIINDTLIISPNMSGMEQIDSYIDSQEKDHKLYYLQNITDLWTPIHNAVFYDNSKEENINIRERIENFPLILDFDLDYFTESHDGKTDILNDE